MTMKSQLKFSALKSRYGLSHILKLNFIGSESFRTMEKKPGTSQIGTT